MLLALHWEQTTTLKCSYAEPQLHEFGICLSEFFQVLQLRQSSASQQSTFRTCSFASSILNSFLKWNFVLLYLPFVKQNSSLCSRIHWKHSIEFFLELIHNSKPTNLHTQLMELRSWYQGFHTLFKNTEQLTQFCVLHSSQHMNSPCTWGTVEAVNKTEQSRTVFWRLGEKSIGMISLKRPETRKTLLQ